MNSADPQKLTQIRGLFESNPWFSDMIADDFEDAVQATYRMSLLMKNEEYLILVKLLENYIYCSANNLRIRIQQAVQPLCSEESEYYLGQYDKIWVVSTTRDYDANKSGESISYAVKSRFERTRRRNGFNYSVESLRPMNLYRAMGITETPLVVVSDDFIGTAETMLEVLNDVEGSVLGGADVICLSGFAMNHGIGRIQAQGYYLTTGEVLPKCLSESNYFDDSDSTLRVMAELGSRITLSDYVLGYKCSEGLITLERTPDNTLPMFWEENREGKEAWEAPFPRK